jgi:hypothetical protein
MTHSKHTPVTLKNLRDRYPTHFGMKSDFNNPNAFLKARTIWLLRRDLSHTVDWFPYRYGNSNGGCLVRDQPVGRCPVTDSVSCHCLRCS